MNVKDIQALRAIAEREGMELGDFLAKIANERNRVLKK
jgi:predicted DNA-binding ribbon-helix-helix protein